MSTRSRSLAALRAAIAGAFLAVILPGHALAAGVVTVTPADLGTSWDWSGLGAGTGAFVAGPASPPLGVGSFEMTTAVENVDKSTLVTSDFTGDRLSDLSALSYWTYRSSASTSASFTAPSVNIAIFTNADGPGTGFATLVFEPLYAFGNGAIQDDVWQAWDTFAPTQTAFAGGWWVTRQVGALCPSACYADFATIVANAPDATILSVGLNVGRGPASFIGAVDGLSLTMAGETTTYDFEPLRADKAGCKDGGWVDFVAPTFRNQGDCVSWVTTGGRNDGAGPAVAPTAKPSAAKAARAEDRVTRRLSTSSHAAGTNPATDHKPAKHDSAKGAASSHGKGK